MIYSMNVKKQSKWEQGILVLLNPEKHVRWLIDGVRFSWYDELSTLKPVENKINQYKKK